MLIYRGIECIRMPRLPGSVLSNLCAADFQHKKNAVESFDNMLRELTSKNIRHSDLYENNILYDTHTNTFHPIDRYDKSDDYNKMSPDEQNSLNYSPRTVT